MSGNVRELAGDGHCMGNGHEFGAGSGRVGRFDGGAPGEQVSQDFGGSAAVDQDAGR
jgi:hypothetical protein